MSTRIYYEAVQEILTRRITQGQHPSTIEIQEEVFDSAFSSDSRRQRGLVYGAIAKGRENALDAYGLYVESPQHLQDMMALEFYKADEMQKQLDSRDYGEFFAQLKMGRFGDKQKVIETHLDNFVLVAAIWETKMAEYSQAGNNLVVSSYGNRATWIIPSWWRWALRETDLYLRQIDQLQRQFQRGIKTGLLTASGVPLSKAIEYTTSVKGVLEDGTTWRCGCGMHNSGSSNFCSNCGTAQPPQPSLP